MPRILIVEDDPHTSAMLAKLLSAKGHRTRVESNGAAALLAAHEDLPDLILMDLRMPILEGQDAIHALRRDPRTEDIPVVVLTACDDDHTLVEALAAGANIYLIKPPDPIELFTIVERLTSLKPKDEAPT